MKITKRQLRRIIREEKERLNEGTDPKRVFYDVILPALQKELGITGPAAFTMAKDAVDAAWADLRGMFGENGDRHRGPPSGDYS